jgi:hypothetical protein
MSCFDVGVTVYSRFNIWEVRGETVFEVTVAKDDSDIL